MIQFKSKMEQIPHHDMDSSRQIDNKTFLHRNPSAQSDHEPSDQISHNGFSLMSSNCETFCQSAIGYPDISKQNQQRQGNSQDDHQASNSLTSQLQMCLDSEHYVKLGETHAYIMVLNKIA